MALFCFVIHHFLIVLKYRKLNLFLLFVLFQLNNLKGIISLMGLQQHYNKKSVSLFCFGYILFFNLSSCLTVTSCLTTLFGLTGYFKVPYTLCDSILKVLCMSCLDILGFNVIMLIIKNLCWTVHYQIQDIFR